ncbi:MAG: hypothetical protein U9Q83_06870 [Bacteroidota bacterium]|nr:hypothetical protein [Bacteroidota bacterium]
MYEHISYLPENYEKTEKEYPLLIFLHDEAQQGYEFEKIKNIGIPKLLESKKLHLDMITVCPQAPKGETWKTGKLMNLLAKINVLYRINTDKIYFVGIGIGGYGALKFATIYKDIPTAVISVAGGGNENMAFYLKNIPIWIFHGIEDEQIPFYKAKALVDALQNNEHLNFTAIENAGHEIIDTVFDNQQIFNWILEQREK